MIPLGVLGAAHVPAAGGGALIADTFTRADATGLGTTETGGATWVYGSGTSGTSVWRVTSGAAALSSSDTDLLNVALVDVGSSDMEAEVTVTSAGGTTRRPGVVARGTPGGASGYVMWFGTKTVAVMRFLSTGEEQRLFNSEIARADGLRLRLRTVEEGGATRIIAHVDDVEIYNATDSLSTRPTGTHAGFCARLNGCLLDDFEASAI